MFSEKNCTSTTTSDDMIQANMIVLLIVDLITEVLTLAANVVFLIVLVRQRSLHSPSNMLLGALCVADLIIVILVQPLFIAHIITFEIFDQENEVLQRMLEFSFDLCFGLSFTYVILISLDRYAAICHPYRYCSKATCKSHLYTAIICGILVAALFAVDSYFPITNKQTQLVVQMTFYLRIVHFFLPAIVILFCYFKIYLVIRSQRKTQITIGEKIEAREEEHSGNIEPKRAVIKNENCKKKSERRRNGTIALVLLSFYICYTPNFVLVMMILFKKVCLESTIMRHFLHWTSFALLLSGLLHPLVYYLRIKEIRNAVKRIAKQVFSF